MNKKFLEEFNNNRTPFWLSVLFLLIESIIPGLMIWLFLSKDFVFEYYYYLPEPNLGYIFLIAICYIIYSIFTTILFWKVKWHKTDNFTFSLTTSILFAYLTIISFGLDNSSLNIFVKFITSLAILIISTFFGVFLTAYFRNLDNKRIEFYQDLLIRENDLSLIDEKKLSRFKIKQNKINTKKELMTTKKKEIELKLKEKLIYREKSILDKKRNLNDKLTQKEIKKIEKRKEKDTNF